ncbi:MAG: hypothetical protein KGM98_10285 [Bacteroidota bacterium]|nr:hypothetical protein [Bacteroidota bacterium]
MQRRQFIYLSAMGAVAVTLPLFNCNTPVTDLEKVLSVPHILSELVGRDTVLEIGTAYGQLFPGEYKVKALDGILRGVAPGSPIQATTAPEKVMSLLDQNIKEEFTEGKTLVIRGWVLTVTEARQCALYSLVAPKK